jgi:hypothetical protein
MLVARRAMQAKKPAFEQPGSLNWNAFAEVAAQPALAADRPRAREIVRILAVFAVRLGGS